MACSKCQLHKFHIINHLSWLEGLSVNDGIPDKEAFISYNSFNCAIKDLQTLGLGTIMAKLDLKDAFWHISLGQGDWHLFGFVWSDQFHHLLILAFGLKTAPYIFNLFAEVLHWIIQHHIPTQFCHYYHCAAFANGPLSDH